MCVDSYFEMFPLGQSCGILTAIFCDKSNVVVQVTNDHCVVTSGLGQLHQMHNVRYIVTSGLSAIRSAQ